jgi:hypothetical protein
LAYFSGSPFSGRYSLCFLRFFKRDWTQLRNPWNRAAGPGFAYFAEISTFATLGPILTDYFGAKTGGTALAEALYEPFKFTVIAVLPDCWEMNFEEVGVALCRTLTEEPDRLNRVLSGLENAVLDEFVGRQERNEPLNPADLSESTVAGIVGMLREAFSMSRAYAACLVERHYAGLHASA